MNIVKCDNCPFEADVDVHPEAIEEIWCEDCDLPKWRAVVCGECYDKHWKIEIFIQHSIDCHTAVDLI